MKKTVSILLALLFACGAVACGRSELENEFGNRPKSFTFCYYESGYDTDWIEAVARDYMENVNTEVYIDLKGSKNNETARTKIKSGVGTYDLYQIEVDMFNSADYLEDLSSLYETEVYGEPGVFVKDKVGERWVDYYNEDGHWYQLPQTSLTGWNWVYNKTLLDRTFPDGYELPRTTQEFFSFGEELYQKGIFLTAFSGGSSSIGGDYLPYAYETWFAQMTGLTNYNHYYAGEYYDATTDSWKLSRETPRIVTDNRNAIEAAFGAAEVLCTPGDDMQLVHSSSETMSYTETNRVFYGGTLMGQKTNPIAFHYTGGWLETEVSEDLADGLIQPGQEVRAIKMPVISDIIEVLPEKSVADDNELSAVIAAIDAGETALKGTGYDVEQADYDRIKEARNLLPELICRSFVVTKSAKNKPEIMEFLSYLASDRAQLIASKANHGINPLPYGYEPTEEEMGFAISGYTESVQNIAREALIVDIGGLNQPFKSMMAISWYKESSTTPLSQLIYTRTPDKRATADTIVDITYNLYNSDWTYRIEQYELSQKK